jgi:hypothetical protein
MIFLSCFQNKEDKKWTTIKEKDYSTRMESPDALKIINAVNNIKVIGCKVSSITFYYSIILDNIE